MASRSPQPLAGSALAPRALSGALVAFVLASVGACSLDNPGTDPPAGQLHFPIALAIDEGRLFVANSDFDLRYNGGIITALGLDAIDAAIDPSNCTAASPCRVSDIAPLLAGPGAEVKVGAFASDIELSTQGRRLFALVRGDGAVVSIDLDRDGRTLSCFDGAASEATPRCEGRYLRGKTADQTERRLVLPSEPQSLVVVPLAGDGEPDERQAIVVTHATAGRASLFLDREVSGAVLPTLVSVLDGLADGATTATYDRATNLIAIANRTSGSVERVGIADDPNIARSYLYRGGDVPLAGVNTGRDARGMIFEPDGSRAYVVQRSPGSLMRIDLRGSRPVLESVLEVCPGASLIVEHTGAQLDGSVRRLFYVTCYDAQQIFVIDPELGEVVDIVHTGGGPHELVFDPTRPRAYLADFRDSVIRVLSLDPERPESFRRVIAILGEVRTVRGID